VRVPRPLDPAVLREDPYPVYARLREKAPSAGLVPLALPDLTEMDLSAPAKNAAKNFYDRWVAAGQLLRRTQPVTKRGMPSLSPPATRAQTH
jgi:hypothetical protein